ncbi:major histocompatibility complex class I-related gene protein-like isoform X2 [Ahaetulla prasina]|uniref:major histocompatibility complex class I-related gene protein-like isoform X2 n=1 Tax=Ahaetulla prasina TaxID=499056 RepID=UPI002648DFC3|nr:major histocompatibility complex class I-related gene protein-like isoform X2 [Ahaetulla prasina]
MALRSAPFLLLVLVAVALRESCFGASSHSLKYFYTSISEPSQGQPKYVAMGYVDDQIFVHYDSNSRRMKPRVSWMEKVGKENPQYWDRESQTQWGQEEVFRYDLENLRSHYNQSEGLHTWQRMCGCELRRDGSKVGFNQLAYEGKTFITFDKETLTWVASEPLAQMTQRKWNAIPGEKEERRAYLEKICIEWLEKYLSYGKETLLRTETPKVTMSSRTEVEDGMEMHVCQVHGFYPREIDASWKRDGEVWLQDTHHASVAPNADGTYHYWLSIRIDPKERDRYRCHVEHDGLQDPLDLELKEPTNSKSNLGLIIGCIVAALVLVGVIAGILVFFKKRQDDYNAAPTSERGANSSDQEDPDKAEIHSASFSPMQEATRSFSCPLPELLNCPVASGRQQLGRGELERQLEKRGRLDFVQSKRRK